MRTREQLQAWIRQGMPVPGELERPDGGRCTVFVVAVERTEGRLDVICQGCGRGTAVGGMLAVERVASSVWTPVRDVRVWMAEHAKEDLGYPRAARHFRDSEEQGARMRVWAAEQMRSGTFTGAGKMSVQDSDLPCPCVIYLMPGPVVFNGRTGATREPFKRRPSAGAWTASAGEPE